VKQSRDTHCSGTQCQHGIVFVFRCGCMYYDASSAANCLLMYRMVVKNKLVLWETPQDLMLH